MCEARIEQCERTPFTFFFLVFLLSIYSMMHSATGAEGRFLCIFVLYMPNEWPNEREIEWKFVIRQKKKKLNRTRSHTQQDIARIRDELQKIGFEAITTTTSSVIQIHGRNASQVHFHFQWKSIFRR